jgi:hypothetical protein
MKPFTDDARSSPLGFFNLAESYWAAAVALENAGLRTTHPTSPISFLYYHAIELYLKAFLRTHGHSARELRGKNFGHRTCCLSEKAGALDFTSMTTTYKSFRSCPVRMRSFGRGT